MVRRLFICLCCLISFISYAQSEGVSDYLIVPDIGSYQGSKNPTSGYGAGVLAGAGHFYLDHNDMTYRDSYFDVATRTGAEVQVTQHPGSDADQWLLHEISRDFRSYYGLPGESFAMREANGSTIMALGSGGWAYRWLSGNKVIHIEYTDLQMEKPEPLEIVNAYLAKHPSTLPVMTSSDLRTSDNKTQWIKDEMSRRLWLCDKWLAYDQAGANKIVDELVDHLTYFLRYREKYYGVSAKADLILLDGYKQADNKAAIETKLAEYKTWWVNHKKDSISLP